MKPSESIWLNEYEGLLPAPVAASEPSRDSDTGPRSLPEHEAVSPHFELTPANLERTSPLAFLE